MLSPVQDRFPAQARLKAIQYQEFEMLFVVVSRCSPFSIVIGEHLLIMLRPGTLHRISNLNEYTKYSIAEKRICIFA